MDNLTHSLVGLAAAKAGLERLSPGATVMCVIAANAPDADILTVLGGRWMYLQHHRGITHSIVGTFALALLIPVLFWLGDQIFARVVRGQPRVKLRGMLLASLIVSATHPILDWTNNYGIRPLLPWNGKWFYGDLVFIIDPWIWLSFGGACFLLTSRKIWQMVGWSILAAVLTTAIVVVPMIRSGSIFPLAARIAWIIGIIALIAAHRARLPDRWGSALAVAVFGLIVAYWGGLAFLHNRALARATVVATGLASANGETTSRLVAMPVLANPSRWQCVFETNNASYRFDLSLIEGRVVGEPVRFEKPFGSGVRAYDLASRDERAKIFLGFARFPVARIEGDCVHEMLVQFADLRYTEPGGGRRGAFSLEVPIECPDRSGALETK